MRLVEINNFVNEVMEGWKITTDEEIITIAVSAWGKCCEIWGYIVSDPDFKYFINAELLEVTVIESDNYTEKSIIDQKIDTGQERGEYDELQAAFINLKTDRGVLQFAVYNSHNGYYGHNIEVTREKK